MDGQSNRGKTAPYTHITIRKKRKKKNDKTSKNKKKSPPPNPASCHRHLKIVFPRHQHERGKLSGGGARGLIPNSDSIHSSTFAADSARTIGDFENRTKTFFFTLLSPFFFLPPSSKILKRGGPDPAFSRSLLWLLHTYLSAKQPHVYALVRITL